MISAYSVPPAIGATAVLLLGLFVLLQNKKAEPNRALFALCFSASLWLASHVITYSTMDIALAAQYTRIGCTIVAFVPVFLHHFVASFLNLSKERRLVRVSYAVTFGFAIGLLFTNLFISGTHKYFWGFYSKVGLLHPLFLLTNCIIWLRSYYLLYKALRGRSSPNKLKQTKYIFAASIIGLPATIDYLPKYGFEFYPFGFIFVLLFTVIAAYAIVRHNFLDIHVVIRKSLAYSILVTILTVGYFSLIYLAEQISRTTLGYQSTWISLVAFSLMALTFQPLKIGVQKVVDWLIFRMPQEGLAKKVERLEEQALLSEKFKAVSTLAAGMAHEIKNPLTALTTFTEFIPEKHGDPLFAKKLHEVFTRETRRIHDLVKDVLDFAKPKAPQTESVDLTPLVDSTVNFLSGELLKRKIEWQVDYQHNGQKAQVDPDQIRQVLINLIQNAADAMPDGGKLNISTQPVNGHLELTVSDTGEGIPKKLLPKIFDPFVTTKENGNGLGLAMVYSILRANHGTIRAENRRSADGSVANRPCGAAFIVSLPL